MSIWKDLSRDVSREDHAGHISIRKPCGDIRLALLVGFAEAIDKENRGKHLRFIHHGNKEEGTLSFLRVHLVEVRSFGSAPEQRPGTFVTCSLFLWEDTPIPETAQKSFMSCNIVTPSGRRNDDIFIFLTDIFPDLLRNNRGLQ